MPRAIRGLFVLVAAGVACGVAGASEPVSLTLQEAHETALRNHPLISVADLRALVARQITREAQSAFYPNLSANMVNVGVPQDNTRLSGVGLLSSSTIFSRDAEGLVLSQLITDFGRTANLTGSAKLKAQAAASNAQATRQQILLAVDGAFFSAEQAQAVTRVAQQTVTQRQVFQDQVKALTKSQLRSGLDDSFATVNLAQAKVILLRGQNDLQAALVQLTTLMGLREPQDYRLVEEPMPAVLSSNVSIFVQAALSYRPDLLSLRNQSQASLRFARAEKELRYPTISAVGTAGVVPIHDAALSDTFAAAGVVVTVPVFAGGYYSARQRAAELEAQADASSVRDLEDNVIRDVRVAWLNAQNAYERYQVNLKLLDTARLSYDLAQASYKAGLTSIVEFNQAELNLLSAQISVASTQYEYLTERSVLTFQTGQLR